MSCIIHAPRKFHVKDDNPVILLIIDPQIDFHEGGSLAVPGAHADALRIKDMIMNHLDDIGEIFVTLDSHHKKHIAHAAFWSDKEDGCGTPPEPFTTISYQDLVAKKWFPKDLSLMDHCINYTKKLKEAENHFDLTIWPDHCLIGTLGHSVHDEINEALKSWADRNYKKSVKYIHKGMNCLTEMYSAIKAEVPIITDPSTALKYELLQELKKAKRLLICGQARSHCVNLTTRDIRNNWPDERSQQIYVLEDGCSSVQSPYFDFEKEVSQKFFKDMREKGVVVTTIAHAFDGLEKKMKE